MSSGHDPLDGYDRPTPPRLSRRLIRWVLPPDMRDTVTQDLDQIFEERCVRGSMREARRWYRGQVWRSLGPALARRAGGRGRHHGPGELRRWNRGGDRMASIRQDLMFAAKQLRKHPAVALTVIGTLAMGIGATTAIFSAVHGVLLTPLPYDDPSELVLITSRAGASEEVRYLSGPDALDLAEQVRTVDDVALFGETTIGPLTDVDRPAHIKTTWATWNAFRLLGIDAAIGRTFVPDDATPLQDTLSVRPPWAAVISHDFWVRHFGANPDVLGQVVHIWYGSAEIVGVLPPDVRILTPPELNLGGDVDVWNVSRADIRDQDREGRWYRVVGRLSDGVTVAGAQREVDRFAAELRRRFPHHDREETRLRVGSFEDAVAAPVRGILMLLMGAVTLVLLIACFNSANLLLAHGTTRANEMAVRRALGAERPRLIRQLLTESAALAAVGALLGVFLAALGVQALQRIRPTDLHRLQDVQLDAPVLAFTVAVAAAATMLSGLLPALHASRGAIGDWLRVRSGTGRGQRARAVLVTSQVALSVVLLAGAGLMIRTFSELQRLPLGFEPDRVLTVTATQSIRPPGERRAYEAELHRAVAAIPGVESVGIVFPLPMNGVYDRSAEYALGQRAARPDAWTVAYFRTVSPTYFDAVGIEVLRGRGFIRSDENPDAPVVVIDERLARREWGGRDPVGETLYVRGLSSDTLSARVVGVVEYVPQWDHRDTQPTMYLPRTFYLSHEVSVVARVSGDPAAAAPAVASAIRSVDPGFPADLTPMTALVSERLAASRFLLVLMQIFAAVALALSGIGLYGVLSYAVRQRTRELGIRLAFGAVASSLTARVVWRGAGLAGIGIGIGLLGALGVGRAMEAQLFGVTPTDPLALGSTALAVLLVSILASFFPALRAARVDPMVALRED